MKIPSKQSEVDELARRLLAVRHDPVAWVKELGDKPWSAQEDILRAVSQHKHVAVRSCHGIGKDWTAARVVLWFLLHHSPSLVLTTGPTDRQVRGILWKEIAVIHRNAGLPGTLLTQELKLAPDWYAWGFTAPPRDSNKFQGFHEKNILVVVDEASGVTPEIYSSISGVLSSEGARLLEIGNPTDPLSSFAKSFSTKRVHKISVSAFDTPNFTEFGITVDDIANDTWRDKITGDLPYPKLVTPQWVAERAESWGIKSGMFASRVLGEFPSDSPDSLIPLRWIERAVDGQSKTRTPVELGVDVAAGGDDHSVIVLRQGDYAEIVYRAQGNDLMGLVGQCVKLRTQYRATAIKVDSIGVGAGVVSRLRELQEPVFAANAGANSRLPDAYVNAKAEWFWMLRQRFENGSIVLHRDSAESLSGELIEFKWAQGSKGRIAIESKPAMKRRLHGRSPDRADALAIAFAVLPGEEKTEIVFI